MRLLSKCISLFMRWVFLNLQNLITWIQVPKYVFRQVNNIDLIFKTCTYTDRRTLVNYESLAYIFYIDKLHTELNLKHPKDAG